MKNFIEVLVKTLFMNQPKFLDEVLTRNSKKFLEKIGRGDEVITRTYLGLIARTYFMNQPSEIFAVVICKWSHISR